MTLLQCQQLVDELRRAARRAVGLHQQVNFLSLRHRAPQSLPHRLSLPQLAASSQPQMAEMLQDAMEAVQLELQGALRGGRGHGAPRGQEGADGMMLLLERYSEELVQMTRSKLKL